MQIGERVKELRKAHGLTQRELAELTGINHANIGLLEVGRYNICIKHLDKIAQVLNVNIDLR